MALEDDSWTRKWPVSAYFIIFQLINGENSSLPCLKRPELHPDSPLQPVRSLPQVQGARFADICPDPSRTCHRISLLKITEALFFLVFSDAFLDFG